MLSGSNDTLRSVIFLRYLSLFLFLLQPFLLGICLRDFVRSVIETEPVSRNLNMTSKVL